jgi:hypothetical protein
MNMPTERCLAFCCAAAKINDQALADAIKEANRYAGR